MYLLFYSEGCAALAFMLSPAQGFHCGGHSAKIPLEIELWHIQAMCVLMELCANYLSYIYVQFVAIEHHA